MEKEETAMKSATADVKSKRKIGKKLLKPEVKPLTREEEDALLPDMETKIVKLSWLRRWKRNPRENKDAARKLAKLIRKHGFRVPIICTPEGKIWSGDTRYQAAELLGMTRVRVLITEFEDRAKAMMFALAENKSAEWARWDPDLLSDAFSERTQMDIDEMVKLSGFAPMEIQKLRGVKGDAVDGPEALTAGSELLDSGFDAEDASWFRIVIVCRSDVEKRKLFRMLGIDGKKIIYTIDDLKQGTSRKRIKRRKIS